MTREVFLNSLREKLKGLSPEDIEDRISFYYEMIDDMMDEGKTEEQAVADIGTTDEAVRTIASQTKMSTLVKEKMRTRRSLTGWELLLIVLAFPMWLPLLIVALVFVLVGYLMTWILVIATYSTEAGLLAGVGGGLVVFICSLLDGTPDLIAGGGTLACIGGACLVALLCIAATKITLKLNKNIFLGIKSKIIKGRN